MTIEIVKDIIEEMDGRMENIKTFYPFFKIHKSISDVKKEYEYDIPVLCLCVLSYLIYEGKLKYKGVTHDEITEFLIEFIKHSYKEYIDRPEAKRYVGVVLDKLQNEGSNFTYQYYSLKTGDVKQKIIKLIEMKLDDDNNTFHYFITKEGLDFFLKTKEFPEETQITINLLLFRKQIEKGSFEFAFETVKRLNVEVQRKIEKKNWILDLLMYGGKEGGTAYREYHTDAMSQFKEENELFADVNKLLNNVHQDYIEKINKNIITDKENKAFNVLKQIEREMNTAMENHTRLLKEAAGLTKEYDNILKLKTKAAFSERFNFEGEFEKIVDKTDKPSRLKYIIEPMLTAGKSKSFNILKVFQPQRILGNQEKENYKESRDTVVVNRKTIDDVVSERVKYNFRKYAEVLLKMFNEKKEFNLMDWCKAIKENLGESGLLNGDFISFVLRLNHGKKPGTTIKSYNIREIMNLSEDKITDIKSVLKEVINDMDTQFLYNKIDIESKPGEDVNIGRGVKITNLLFKGSA